MKNVAHLNLYRCSGCYRATYDERDVDEMHGWCSCTDPDMTLSPSKRVSFIRDHDSKRDPETGRAYIER